MTWTPDIIRARFVEAADTERRMPAGRAPTASGFWPAFQHTFEDMNGWGTKRLAEERELRELRIPPSAAAISRHIEALQWTAALIPEERRKLVWAWAFCQTSGRSFAEHCRRQGWVKMTAYRRLSAVFQLVSEKLSKNNALLRLPDEKWLLPEQPVSGSNPHTLATLDGALNTHPTFHVFEGGKAANTLSTEADIDQFAAHLAATNEARRKEQRRREKLGLSRKSGLNKAHN